jgi:hypothetical protein
MRKREEIGVQSWIFNGDDDIHDGGLFMMEEYLV